MIRILLCTAMGLSVLGTSSSPGIFFNAIKKEFRLQTLRTTYAFRISPDTSNLEHLYWGPMVLASDDLAYLADDSVPLVSFDMLKDTQLLEYADFGSGDFKSPSFEVEYADGTRLSPVVYKAHQILQGKVRVDEGLPSLYNETVAECQSLCITMHDPDYGLEVDLWWTIYLDYDVVLRQATIRNLGAGPAGSGPVLLRKAASATLMLPAPSHSHYEMTQLSGSWANENNVISRKVDVGTLSVGSTRGLTSHISNPFVVLSDGPFSETSGFHYSAQLVYSTNWLAEVQGAHTGRARLNIGINPQTFDWLLNPGESFSTPEAVLAFSSEGVGGISRQLHKLYRTRMVRGLWRDRKRPVLVNSWEAMYFDMTEDRIVNELALPATKLGVDLVVVDDGWFGHRDNDTCCLGDWTPNPQKFPNGLQGLSKRVNALGLNLGIWMEPEMISPNSDLYRQHPDWCVHVGNRTRSQARNQLVLDLSRPEIQDFVVSSVTKVLTSANIMYLKWDFNRALTEVGTAVSSTRSGELYHRWMLGAYRVMRRLTTAFPDVLFEGCAGGGGRFDVAMMEFFPQIWTSDDTDAVARSSIQYGASLGYPSSVMAAHVSVVPNQQLSRTTPLLTRLRVASGGSGFGFELALNDLSADDQSTISNFLKQRATWEQVVREGDMYRLVSPFESPRSCWMWVSPDQRQAIFVAVQTGQYHVEVQWPHIKLQGLDPETVYEVQPTNQRFSGRALMGAGVLINYLKVKGDADSVLLSFTATDGRVS